MTGSVWRAAMRRPEPFIFLGAFLVYAVTTTTVVLGGDNGEFASIFHGGGLGHAPGYPLYVFILRLFSWVPSASPAHGAALVTAACGAAGLALLFRALVVWGLSRTASVSAIVLFAVSPTVWRLNTEAEVFALNIVLVGAIAYCTAPDAELKGLRRVFALAVLGGLGLCHHHTLVFLAPVGLWGVVQGFKETGKVPAAVGLGFLGFGLGLTPYLLVFFLPEDAAWIWGEPTSVDGFWRLVTRADFGSFQLTGGDAEAAGSSQILRLLKFLVVEWGLFGTAFLIAGATVARRAPRAVLVSAGVTWALAGPVFVVMMGVRESLLAKHIMARFFVLPQLLLIPLVAAGVDVCLRKFERKHVVALVVVATAFHGFSAYLSVAQRHEPVVEQYLENTLTSLPQNAVLLTKGDHHLFGFLYMQKALGLRGDVTVLDAAFLSYDWYREAKSKELHVALPALGSARANRAPLAKVLLETRRPLFMTFVVSKSILAAYPNHPYGTTIRVLDKDSPLPSLIEVEQQQIRVYETFKLEGNFSQEPHGWQYVVQEAYARPWLTLAQAFEQRGETKRAADLRTHALLFAPWM